LPSRRRPTPLIRLACEINVVVRVSAPEDGLSLGASPMML
jgi:hypothetical protein